MDHMLYNDLEKLRIIDLCYCDDDRCETIRDQWVLPERARSYIGEEMGWEHDSRDPRAW